MIYEREKAHFNFGRRFRLALDSDVEYDVNIKAKMEIAFLHEKTDRINEQILERFASLEKILTEKI